MRGWWCAHAANQNRKILIGQPVHLRLADPREHLPTLWQIRNLSECQKDPAGVVCMHQRETRLLQIGRLGKSRGQFLVHQMLVRVNEEVSVVAVEIRR